jgi:aminoglycoside phosphotransferase family enzyme/predicted kinase
MTQANVQSDVIEFLSRPETYGVPGPVERHETHASVVFLAGERAYKLKRAVRYPYLNYETAARRRAMCEAELSVNRRTARELYIGVVPIVRDGDALRFGDHGRTVSAIDWVVVMRRFAQEDLFEQLQRRRKLSEGLVREVAEAIASLHGTAEVRCDFGGAKAISRVVRENIAILRRMAGAPFHPEKVGRLALLSEDSLNVIAARLDRRRDQGFVRRCHGDLHLNNICLFSGRAVLFDAIEFNDDFSCIDVFYDLAFLLMDIDRRGLRALANAALNRYLEKSGDYDGVGALPLFLSCRAAVRAHVTATAAERIEGERKAVLIEEALQFVESAIGYLECVSVRAIAVGGLSGTGKTALARLLAPSLGRAPGAVVLRSDVLRKRLAGVDDKVRLPPSAYAPETHHKVYGEMRGAAATLLAAGHSIIADAVHGRAEERRSIEAVARDAGAQFTGLWLHAPPDVLEGRLAARKLDASDATAEVLRAQLGNITVPEDWWKIDASGSREEMLEQCRTSAGLSCLT